MIKILNEKQFIEIKNCCKSILVDGVEFIKVFSYRTAIKNDYIREYKVFKDVETGTYYKVMIIPNDYEHMSMIRLTSEELEQYEQYL